MDPNEYFMVFYYYWELRLREQERQAQAARHEAEVSGVFERAQLSRHADSAARSGADAKPALGRRRGPR